MATQSTSTPAPIAHVTRRSLLAAAPAIAVIASVPALAGGGQFERAVADFQASVRRQTAAGIAHDAYERADDGLTEPAARTIKTQFQFAGQTIERDHTLRPWDCDHPASDIADHPDFASYTAEVREWRRRREEWRIANNGPAIEKEWEDAVDAHCEAWTTLAECPAPTIAALAQ